MIALQSDVGPPISGEIVGPSEPRF